MKITPTQNLRCMTHTVHETRTRLCFLWSHDETTADAPADTDPLDPAQTRPTLLSQDGAFFGDFPKLYRMKINTLSAAGM